MFPSNEHGVYRNAQQNQPQSDQRIGRLLIDSERTDEYIRNEKYDRNSDWQLHPGVNSALFIWRIYLERSIQIGMLISQIEQAAHCHGSDDGECEPR